LRRIHACIVTPAFPQLSETFIVDHATQLAERGHRVTVLSTAHGSDAAAFPDLARLSDQIEHVSLDLSSSRGVRAQKSIATLLAPGALSPRDRGRVALTAARQQIAPTSVLLLSNYFKAAEPPDVVHAHFGTLGASVQAALSAVRSPSPLVVTFHGFDISRIPKSYGPDVYQNLFEQGSLFLAVSERWRIRLLELGAPAKATQLHRLGVRLPDCEAEFDGETESDTLRVCSVARLVEKKGIEDAIRAVVKAHDSGIALRYDIIGDGPLRSQLQSLTTSFCADDYVNFLGAQPRTQAFNLLADSDVFLAPSITAADGDQEGIPVAIMEAMAFGLSILSTYHSGIPELVDDNRTGLLVRERDVDAMSAALAGLGEDVQLRRSLGSAARREIQLHWNADLQADALIRKYDNVIGSNVDEG